MIVVLADDMTGAAEMAGIGWKAGYRVNVQTDRVAGTTADMVVIDTDTRSKQGGEASQIVSRLVRKLAEADFDFLYKKTDSALRGHIALEIDAILKNTAYERAVFVPANPSLGRIIDQGMYYVRGVPINQTEFARDPDFPISSARVAEVVGTGSEVLVPNVTSMEDLPPLAAQLDKGTFGAGGGDFFAAVLPHRHRVTEEILEKKDCPSIIVQGSLSAYGRRFYDYATSEGWAGVPIPASLILEETDSISATRWIDEARAQVLTHRKVIIRLDRYLAGISSGLVTRRFCGLMAALLSEIELPVDLYIEGGNTASALMRQLQIGALRVTAVHRRGIVSLQALENNNTFIIKPGSYEWPAGLFEMQRI